VGLFPPCRSLTSTAAPLARRCRPQQAALDKAKELASSPRLASGDYGDLVRLLRKILQKDSMIAVAAAAADVAAALAQGLRAEFSAHAKVRACGCVFEGLQTKDTHMKRMNLTILSCGSSASLLPLSRS
jgi:cytoskeleton-associated protein 5